MNILKVTGSFTIIDCMDNKIAFKLSDFLYNLRIDHLICRSEIVITNNNLYDAMKENKNFIILLSLLLERNERELVLP